jgi:hypothetical protein
MTRPTTETTIVTTLQGIQKLRNSHDGCPRFRVFTLSGTWNTEPNAQVNFLITNYVGKRVSLQFNESGNIIGADSV